MQHRYQKPDNRLTELIRTVLIVEGSSEKGSNNVPIFTNGMPVLFCKTEKGNDGYEEIVQLALFGKSPADIWTLNRDSTIIAYFFNPFVAACLFNIQAATLSEKPFDLNLWSPHKYMALKTQLICAAETTRKTEVLGNLLIQQLNENQQTLKIVKYATDQILNNSGKEVLSEILEKLDLNERTFQRIFKNYVGITATQYRRICQFQISFGQLRSKQFHKTSEVAYENGFADQSHFIRAFKEYTQITPNEYLKMGLKIKKK